jgi:hypothetical protein
MIPVFLLIVISFMVPFLIPTSIRPYSVMFYKLAIEP